MNIEAVTEYEEEDNRRWKKGIILEDLCIALTPDSRDTKKEDRED